MRDLRRRVAALEADRDGPAVQREVGVAARSVVEVLGMILFAAAAVGVIYQLEVYYLRPIITGRMVRLSPLAVLVAAVLGIALAGPLGAIAAVPFAGAIQVILVEVLDARADARTTRHRRVIVDGRSPEASAP